MLFRLILTLLFLSLPALAHAADGPPLLHGISLSNWLANAKRQPMSEQDFRLIAEAGFDHVRLPVDPENLQMDQIDRAIKWAFDNKLAIVIEMHANTAFEEKLQHESGARNGFINLWADIARHYDEKVFPRDQLAFELLNEPHYRYVEDQYIDLARKLMAAIRSVSPRRTVIVDAPDGASLEGLQKLQPFDDNHIIYSFHFYEPYMATHQGYHRAFEKTMLRYFHDVPYPSNLVDRDATFYAGKAPGAEQAQEELKDYVQQDWSAEKIGRRLQIAKDWAANHLVRVICGEFGALRTHTDPASRYRWITDVRTALEDDRIGWELWDYADLMGITAVQGEVSEPDPVDGSVHLISGTRSFEPEALDALGLTRKF